MDEIKKFFESHPAIDKTKFEKEFGLPYRSLRDFLNDKTDFPKKHLDKLMEGIVKYSGSNDKNDAL